MGGWYSYRASKAAANQIVRSAAIEISRKFPNRRLSWRCTRARSTTLFTQSYPAHKKVSAAQAAVNLVDSHRRV